MRRLIRWWRQRKCRRVGHLYYPDDIGGVIYRFCARCDMKGEVVAERLGVARDFAASMGEFYGTSDKAG